MSSGPGDVSRRALLAAAAAAALAACTADRNPPVGAGTSSPEPSSRVPTAGSESPTASASPTATPHPTGPDIVHGPAHTSAVALTFHGAGEPALARRALKTFADANAHATVLAVGTWLSANPSLATAILDGGHDLGNHTWSHQVMPRLTRAAADHEVARCARLLRGLVGNGGSWFRPSGTPDSTPTIRAAAHASGYPRCLSYDVDPRDYLDPGASVVRARVLDAVRPGSIVSLHLGHAGTVEALPGILDGLAAKGLRATTATELLGPIGTA